MQLRSAAEASVRKPPLPLGPTAVVYFGAKTDPGDVGLLAVRVPVGGSMPAHRHQGSDVILAPTAGSVRVEKRTGDDVESVEVGVGDALFIDKEESVSLSNSGEEEAQLIVAAAPTAFVHTVTSWPTV